MNYTAVIIKEDTWYAGFIKELPGANSQGKTIDEVIENLREAVTLILESNMKHNLADIEEKDYFEQLIEV